MGLENRADAFPEEKRVEFPFREPPIKLNLTDGNDENKNFKYIADLRGDEEECRDQRQEKAGERMLAGGWEEGIREASGS